ncbi:MAG: L,D-transpeptidase [Longimicrobiales bacterium]|jgi:hypothetical protein
MRGALPLALFLASAPAAAQESSRMSGGPEGFRADVSEHAIEVDRPLVDHDAPYIVVHLGENRVFLFDGIRSVWSAPAGTGTGFRLDTEEHQWNFSTPRGLFRVQRMEKDPLWEAPDWHFIEKGSPVPPQDHPSRIMAGIMGNTAIFLGAGIAIHGTNQPGLLLNPDPEARRVSHGCIRLTNESARELMHLVDVGTPVLIF